MNILFITERVLVTGGAQVIPETPLAYAKRGHKVYYVSCSHELPDTLIGEHPGYLHENIILYGARLPWKPLFNRQAKWLIPIKRLLFLPVFLYRAILIALRLLATCNIDVLYGYEVYGVVAAHLVRFLHRKKRLPIVSRYQGTVLLPGLGSLRRKLLLWDHILALKLPGDLTIMTNDGTQGDVVLQKLRSPVKELKFWRNGIHPRRPVSQEDISALRTRLGIGPDDHVLLTVSRLVQWKRVDRAIEALALVHQRIPNVKLVIVGDGPCRTMLEELARIKDVENQAIFTGNIDNSEVPKYLVMADVFLSLYDLSNVGNPLLEALRYGKCIVTLNNGATSEVIRNGDNGILLDLSDDLIKRIAAAVVRVLKDSALRSRLEQGASSYADSELWTWEDRMEAEVREVSALVERWRRS